ncbi:hypothetical protein [Gordonia terrae]|uniref:hypothetical protein n=1 Tax=Gordonia terrae TaxID=2055 RepID=UPI00126986A8|nr:hypothetical protein [Gordonia terrae]
MASEWVTGFFALGGVFVGSGGTVYGNWLVARRASADKKVDQDFRLLETTRASVLENIQNYVVLCDEWISLVRAHEGALRDVQRTHQDQTFHDAEVALARDNPRAFDLGELEAHSRTVDREFSDSQGRLASFGPKFTNQLNELRRVSTLCEITAPPAVAEEIEKFTLTAAIHEGVVRRTEWQDLADDPDRKGLLTFSSLRSQITIESRQWNHPK